MNIEQRLQSAANELNHVSRRSAPPALGMAGETVRPWLAFTAAFAVVLAVVGIPYVISNFGQGTLSDGTRLAGASSSTTTTACIDPETTTTIVEIDPETTTTIVEAGDVITTLPPTTEASEAASENPAAADEEPSVVTTDCLAETTTTMIEPTTAPGQMCEAKELYPPTTVANGDPSFDLTEPVAEKLTAIAEAAAVCNASGLAALASDDIKTTFGPGSGPEDIASWQPDDERFGIIAELFNMTHGVTEMTDGSALYVWPAAFAYDTWEEIPTAAMDELLRIYTQEELDQISLLGSYGGWRIGITESGEWIFFVAGD